MSSANNIGKDNGAMGKETPLPNQSESSPAQTHSENTFDLILKASSEDLLKIAQAPNQPLEPRSDNQSQSENLSMSFISTKRKPDSQLSQEEEENSKKSLAITTKLDDDAYKNQINEPSSLTLINTLNPNPIGYENLYGNDHEVYHEPYQKKQKNNNVNLHPQGHSWPQGRRQKEEPLRQRVHSC